MSSGHSKQYACRWGGQGVHNCVKKLLHGAERAWRLVSAALKCLPGNLPDVPKDPSTACMDRCLPSTSCCWLLVVHFAPCPTAATP
jgi:hypothetical protein